MRRVVDILERVEAYHPNADLDLIQRAYVYGAAVRRGAERSATEACVDHAIEMAWILTELHMDAATVSAGLLGDVMRGGWATRDDLEERFGPDVAALVAGIAELDRLRFSPERASEIPAFRKMILALVGDIRILLIQMADRLQELRRHEGMEARELARISREAYDVYAPLANRLGIDWMRAELEDRALRQLEPAAYQRIQRHLAGDPRTRPDLLDRIGRELTELLVSAGVRGRITGRPKTVPSIHRKMLRQGIDLDAIFDLIGFRVFVEDVRDCYGVLGLVHARWEPVPGRFRDYIASPKPNLYQSLHTTVIGPEGTRMEVQIRTEEMDQVAEKGVAAHWVYKEDGGRVAAPEGAAFEGLRELIQSLEEIDDPAEALESFRIDLYHDEVYCFTPGGEIRRLPAGATVLDFAFAIHSEVGQQAIGARVDGHWKPLRQKLRTGETVEVITAAAAHPSRDWLDWVTSSRARQRIRTWLRSEERRRGLEVGQRLLERELKGVKLSLKRLQKQQAISPVAERFGLVGATELYRAVGFGTVPVAQVVEALLPKPAAPPEHEAIEKPRRRASRRSKAVVRVAELDDVLVRFARCCQPVPGDPIFGFVTRGRGITVHDASCATGLATDPGRRMDVAWADDPSILRATGIRVLMSDRRGALGAITRTIGGRGVNITRADTRSSEDGRAELFFTVEIADRKMLDDLFSSLRRVKGVLRVDRVAPSADPVATESGSTTGVSS